jgi:simple sugar transport system permease protein
MSNGRGYIGLSAQNMANGEPVGSALASLLFGFSQALTTTMKNQTNFPTEFLEMIPYVATIVALCITGMVAINKLKKIEQGKAKEE